MKRQWVTIGIAGLFLAGSASAKDELPSNVTTKLYGNTKNRVIDKIDYSFSTAKPVDFARIKLCIAESVTNDEVRLADQAGSFVGSSGTYYRTHNNSTVQGGDIFKYVDEASKSLIARGSIRRRGGLGGLLGLAIRYDLEISASDAGVTMRMLHLEQAMENTGSARNDGFMPIGVWAGSMYKKNIVALDQQAVLIRSCILD